MPAEWPARRGPARRQRRAAGCGPPRPGARRVGPRPAASAGQATPACASARPRPGRPARHQPGPPAVRGRRARRVAAVDRGRGAAARPRPAAGRTPPGHLDDAADSPRRPARRPGDRALVGAARPGRPAGLARRAVDGPHAATFHVPQAPAGQAGPAARARRAYRGDGPRARARSSTRCASTSTATTSRSIDWRATARSGDLVVRTWRPERDRHVLLVLDTGRTAAGRVGDAPRLDAAMDAALLLAALASRAGDRVDLIAHDRVERASVVGASSADLLHQLVQAMAPLDAGLVETDWQAVASTILRRAGPPLPRGTAHGARPGSPGGGAAAGAPAAGPPPPRPARVGRQTPASPSSPQDAADADAVYSAAAGEQAKAARGHLEQVLRRHGVDVVDAPPDALPPALADAYLALKAAGRL